MMGFPIAIGTGPHQSSSRRYPKFDASDVSSNQNDVLLAIGNNDDDSLTATIFIKYRFIAVGNGSSSLPVETPNSEAVNGGNGSTVNGGNRETADNSSQNESNKIFNVIAELRVQIQSSSSPFSSNVDAISRETKCKVPLGIVKERSMTEQLLQYDPVASVVFSSNEAFLACLIPFPGGYEAESPTVFPNSQDENLISKSIVIIFSIQSQSISMEQKMRQQSRRVLPPFPDYVVEKTEGKISSLEAQNGDKKKTSDNTILDSNDSTTQTEMSQLRLPNRNHVSYVAHQPRIVRVTLPNLDNHSPIQSNRFVQRKQSNGSSNAPQSPPLQTATSICDIPTDSYCGKSSYGSSALLIGTFCGSLLLVDFTTARVNSTLLSDTCDEYNNSPVVHISQCPPLVWKPRDAYGEEQGSKTNGRIALVRRDGSVTLYATAFVVPLTESTSFHRTSSIGSDTDYSRSNSASSVVEMHQNLKYSLQLRLEKWNSMGKSGTSGTRLSYIRAKWLNNSFLVLLTQCPNFDSDILMGKRCSIHVSSTETVVAQVWKAVKDDVLMLVSELKLPVGNEDLMNERSHCKFTIHKKSSLVESSTNEDTVATLPQQISAFVVNCQSSMSISWHRGTDCLTLCTQSVTPIGLLQQIEVHSCCLIWDWKRNVSGLMLFCSTTFNPESQPLPSFLSCYYISEDRTNGLSAVHIYEKSEHRIRTIHKDTFRLGMLSPSSGSGNENLRICEPSALLLAPESVLYPFLDHSPKTSDAVLQWEECGIPPNYLLNNGHSRLGAVSGNGKSIAVAGDRGLCILDLFLRPDTKDSRQPPIPNISQWKLFSRVNDEQSFRVAHMVWWDRNQYTKSQSNERSDDILLAVIQYSQSSSSHLVAWSRRRLGFGDDQLLVDVEETSSSTSQSFTGIALPGTRPLSISILEDPSDRYRALLLVTLEIPSSDGGNVIKYAIYQLQAGISQRRKSETILTKLYISGNTNLSTHTTAGMFLAGGSFLFQLNENEKQPPRELYSCTRPAVIIGVITMSQKLTAICAFDLKPIVYHSLIEDQDEDTCSLLLSYQKAHLSTGANENGSRVAWNIAKSDGRVFCWSVPCITLESKKNLDCTQSHTLCMQQPATGELYDLGSSALWMNGASTNDNEVSIGQCKSFACSLFAGQRSRKITLSGHSVSSMHISNCIVGPPPFTSMLYVSFMNLVLKKDCSTTEYYRQHIRSTLRQTEHISSLSSLRIIVFKIIDLLTGEKDSTCTDWIMGKSILREVSYAMSDAFDILATTTFWLSVGRQLEPHQFSLIFPIPNRSSANTAEDLFCISCDYGSLSSALSALPLFSCHVSSQKRVVQLVYHCLDGIKCSVEAMLTTGTHYFTEEVKFIHQLFWFGVKLEDAIESLDDSNGSQLSCDESVVSMSTETSKSSSRSSSPSPKDDCDESSILSSKSPNSTPCRNFFSPSKYQENGRVDEDAIHDAASSFIISGFDSPAKTRLTTPLPVRQDVARSMHIHDDNNTRRKLSFDMSNIDGDQLEYYDVTVAGAVSVFINDTIGLGEEFQHSQRTHQNGWKAISLVAHLLQGDRETSAITSVASPNALRISRVSTIKVKSPLDHSDNNTNKIILNFLQHLISECTAQIQSDASEVIFNLILLLLLRYETCEDVHASKTTLVIVGIVSGHISGRISELVDLSSENPIRSLYLSLVQSNEAHEVNIN